MVLDTCAVLWLAFDRERFSEAALEKIERCDTVRISSLSFWEIGVKIAKRKLVIPVSVADLASLYLKNPRTDIIAPSVDIIVAALALQWPHRDPIDRIIVATARKFKSPIVSADTIISGFYNETLI